MLIDAPYQLIAQLIRGILLCRELKRTKKATKLKGLTPVKYRNQSFFVA